LGQQAGTACRDIRQGQQKQQAGTAGSALELELQGALELELQGALELELQGALELELQAAHSNWNCRQRT
jgi:hypothetical protein